MTRDEALDFLRAHQPMPDDPDLSEELITTYDLVRQYFMVHPDPDCIPLFLNSFGERSGFEVYQLVEAVLTKFPPAVVVPHLVTALRHPRRSIRYWAASIAAAFSVPDLVKPRRDLLAGPDVDSRFAAATALAFINDPRVDGILNAALTREPDEDVREHLSMAIEDRQETLRGTER